MAMAKGAVAAGHPETARAADIILCEGGNAFDAALAAVATATVAEPVLCSLGGGGFLLARPEHGPPRLYDFFAQTPKTRRPATETDLFPIVADFGATQQEFHIGLGSMATPGLLRGLFAVHADLGRMAIAEILEPARQLARRGVVLNRLQAYIFSVVAPIYQSNPAIRAQFANPDRPDVLCGEGDIYRSRDQADSLDALAHEGPDLFYRGEIAQRLAADARDGGGHLGLDDLEGYRVHLRSPLQLSHRGARLLTNPPPSIGGLLIAFALGLLDGIDLTTDGFGGAAHLDRLVAAIALTNRARVESALDGGDAGIAARRLLDPRFLDLYRAELLGRPMAPRGTTHVSVIDRAGNAATVTVSNGEGCGYVLPGTGIVMNNMLGEEDINPHGFHAWPTDTRMASMMAPTVVLRPDGGELALGSGGSNRIRTAILQVLLNFLDFRLSLDDAVRAPRLHVERAEVNAEPGLPRATLEHAAAGVGDLRVWDDINLFFGGVHAVLRESGGGFQGAGDPRRGGISTVVV